MTNKKKRGLWHKKYKTFVFNYFKGICQVCQKPIQEKCDIHHLHYDYKGKLYETEALELIENNVITLVCRTCHNQLHTAINNVPVHDKFTLHNRFNCEICGRNERGILDRKNQQKLEKMMCRKCFLARKTNCKQLKLFI